MDQELEDKLDAIRSAADSAYRDCDCDDSAVLLEIESLRSEIESLKGIMNAVWRDVVAIVNALPAKTD